MQSTSSSSDMQNVPNMANISVTKIWQIQETFIFIVMLQFESKTFNDIFLHFFIILGSDWIVGPGYSSGGTLEKNDEKPTWNHEKP